MEFRERSRLVTSQELAVWSGIRHESWLADLTLALTTGRKEPELVLNDLAAKIATEVVEILGLRTNRQVARSEIRRDVVVPLLEIRTGRVAVEGIAPRLQNHVHRDANFLDVGGVAERVHADFGGRSHIRDRIIGND